jgi:hypothetical protein
MTALAKLSSLEQSYDQARQEFVHIVNNRDSAETSVMTHSELERELEKKGRELIWPARGKESESFCTNVRGADW